MINCDNISVQMYRVFGLNILCELPTAREFGLTPCAAGKPDAWIIRGQVPGKLEDAEYQDRFLSASAASVLLNMKGTARYLIQNGNEIIIEPDAGAAEGDVALYAFGSALGTLLYQRGILALHGSAIRTDHGAVVFSGSQKAGKSTTAAALSTRGWKFMSDDVCAIHLEGDQPLLYPGPQRAKLARDSYHYLKGSEPDDPAVSPVSNKYALAFSPQTEPAILHTICILGTTTGPPHLEPITGTERFKALAAHSYRPRIHQLMESPVQQFRQLAVVSSQARLLRAYRPLDFNGINDFLSLLENEVLT